MPSKLKTLGLAIVAALALTAVMASAAQAQFTSASSGTTTLSGALIGNTHISGGSGTGSITCEVTGYHGTMSGSSAATITLKPSYGPTCTDAFGRVVHVVKNTLEYHFLTGASKGLMTVTGSLELTVTGSTHCTITINGHQTSNGKSYTNNANGTITISSNSSIAVGIHGGFFACGTSATTGTGSYKNAILLSGTSGGSSVSISVH